MAKMQPIDPVIADIYKDLEPRMLPLIKAKARVLARHEDIDDLVQEGRMVVLRVLSGYEYNRCDDLDRYVARCLSNAYKAMYAKITARCRMPRVAYKADVGYTSVPLPPMSLEDIEPDAECASPEDQISETERVRVCADIVNRMLGELKGRELDVFMRIIEPVVFGGARVTTTDVMAALDVNKNMVDWSLYRIRRRFLELCREAFSEVLGDAVSGDGWPHVYAVRGRSEVSVARYLRELQLSTVVESRGEDEAAGEYQRRIDVYSWGSVMYAARNGMWTTVIMRGRFNPLFGEVHGRKQGSLKVPLDWYGSMHKKIKDAQDQSNHPRVRRDV